MRTKEPALYARVLSEPQANAQTIQSEIAALCERVAADGIGVPPDREFIDDGYSGATLVRPALERLRDLAAGDIESIYVHSPDRLARGYAYHVVLLNEWWRLGIEAIFLNKRGAVHRTWGNAMRSAKNPDEKSGLVAPQRLGRIQPRLLARVTGDKHCPFTCSTSG